MANPEHLKILKQGVKVWNKWREENPEVKPDLSGVNLKSKKLSSINFASVDLRATVLNQAELRRSDFRSANLKETQFQFSQLSECIFYRAIIINSNFSFANLNSAKFQHTRIITTSFEGGSLRNANLQGTQVIKSNMEGCSLIKTNFTKSILFDVKIYGIAAWDIDKVECSHSDLIITPPGEPEITVDDLEVAQFIYLMLNNQKIRDVIETITSKAVLILGRFTPERKAVLDALKDELRRRNYLPIVFDFENSENRSLTETVSLLAKMSKFVIADITDAKSIPQELYAIVPFTPSLPVVPIVLAERKEYGMFESIAEYKSVLQLYRYESPESLLANIIPAIINPAEQKVKELRGK